MSPDQDEQALEREVGPGWAPGLAVSWWQWRQTPSPERKNAHLMVAATVMGVAGVFQVGVISRKIYAEGAPPMA